MNRRKFLGHILTGIAGTAAGTGAAKAHLHLAVPAPEENAQVVYDVKGFTCVTCATGLEVMLRDQRGVIRAAASYPDGKVEIGFDRNMISEAKLMEFIASCGFVARSV